MIITYISWDPGGKLTGIAKWDENGKIVEVTELTQLQLDDEMDRIPNTVKVFIIEEYRIYGHIRHTGSKVPTIQVIGQLKAFARKNNIEVVEQVSTLKNMAAMYAQVTVPKGHMPNPMSAYLHGYYYLHHKGLIPAKVLEDYQ